MKFSKYPSERANQKGSNFTETSTKIHSLITKFITSYLNKRNRAKSPKTNAFTINSYSRHGNLIFSLFTQL